MCVFNVTLNAEKSRLEHLHGWMYACVYVCIYTIPHWLADTQTHLILPKFGERRKGKANKSMCECCMCCVYMHTQIYL